MTQKFRFLRNEEKAAELPRKGSEGDKNTGTLECWKPSYNSPRIRSSVNL